MKNAIKLIGIIALIAVIGFSMAGCQEDPTPQTVKYEGTDGSKTYVLTINETDGTYELTVGGKTSKGSATKSGSTWTLTPTGGGAFTVTVNSSGITDIKGEITFTDGSKVDEPGSVTPIPPSTGNDPIAGTWIGTDSTNGNLTIKMVFANGSGKQYMNDKEAVRYTYTFSGNTVTVTTTEVNTTALQSQDGGTWQSYDSLDEGYKVYIPKTWQETISGNTFTSGTITFTKQS